MPYTFTLTSTIPATPQEIYEAWLDSIGHSEMTGAEAVMSDEVGAEVSAWDGYISGRNLELVPGERIVQSWRTTRFSDDHEDSIISVTLEPTEEGTLLTLVHSNVPDDQTSYEEEGWQSQYFEPMQAYFGGRADSREDDEEDEATEGRAEEVDEESEEEAEEGEAETEEEEEDDDEGEEGTEGEEQAEADEETEEEDEEDGEEDDDEEDVSPSRERVFAESVLVRPVSEISRSESETPDRSRRAPPRKRAPAGQVAEPVAQPTTTKKTATKKASAKRTAAKKSAAKKSDAKKAKGKKAAGKKPAAKKAAAKKTSAKKKVGKRAGAAKAQRKGAKSTPRRAAKRKSGRGKRR